MLLHLLKVECLLQLVLLLLLHLLVPHLRPREVQLCRWQLGGPRPGRRQLRRLCRRPWRPQRQCRRLRLRQRMRLRLRLRQRLRLRLSWCDIRIGAASGEGR